MYPYLPYTRVLTDESYCVLMLGRVRVAITTAGVSFPVYRHTHDTLGLSKLFIIDTDICGLRHTAKLRH